MTSCHFCLNVRSWYHCAAGFTALGFTNHSPLCREVGGIGISLCRSVCLGVSGRYFLNCGTFVTQPWYGGAWLWTEVGCQKPWVAVTIGQDAISLVNLWNLVCGRLVLEANTACWVVPLVLGGSGGVVNSLDFRPALLRSLGCFYFRCVLSSQWKAVTVNLRILHCQL